MEGGAYLQSGKTKSLIRAILGSLQREGLLVLLSVSRPWRYKALKTRYALVYQEDNSSSASATHCFWCLERAWTISFHSALLHIDRCSYHAHLYIKQRRSVSLRPEPCFDSLIKQPASHIHAITIAINALALPGFNKCSWTW